MQTQKLTYILGAQREGSWRMELLIKLSLFFHLFSDKLPVCCLESKQEVNRFAITTYRHRHTDTRKTQTHTRHKHTQDKNTHDTNTHKTQLQEQSTLLLVPVPLNLTLPFGSDEAMLSKKDHSCCARVNAPSSSFSTPACFNASSNMASFALLFFWCCFLALL